MRLAKRSWITKHATFLMCTLLALAACTAPKPSEPGVHTQALCSSPNRVACENQQPGSPDWQLQQNTWQRYSHALEGFASATSVNAGDPINLFISSDQGPKDGQLEVFRMGWYNGAGARRVYGSVGFTAPKQTIPTPNTDTGLVQCQWNKTVTLQTSAFLSPDGNGPVTGYYLVRLSIPDANNPTLQAFIPFLVREDNRTTATFLMNAAVTTYQAYNDWGGTSFYLPIPNHLDTWTTEVSFDRPYNYNQGAGNFLDPNPNRLFGNPPLERFPGNGWEYLMVRFLEREGYDVTYATDIELDSPPASGLLTNRAAFLSVGHDEYWSKAMHDNLSAARNDGKHIAFFSGNSVFWIINILNSNRILETHKGSTQQADPNNPWLWQNCSLPRPPLGTSTCPGEESEQTLVGSITTDGYEDRGDIQFNTEDFNLTRVPTWVVQMLEGSQLHAGSRIPGIIGGESQTVCGPGAYYTDCYNFGLLRPRHAVPSGQARFAHSPFNARPLVQTPPPRELWADMSVYPVGNAWVFSAGSEDWNFGLDVYNGNYPVSDQYNRIHPAIPQMTRYVLQQFGDSRPVTPLSAEAYTVTVSRNQNGTYHLVWTNPPGRPPTDFVQVYDINSNDDSPTTYGAKCFIRPNISPDSCDVMLPANVMATADYVTLDLTWGTNWGDQLRTIWRAAKSAQFTAK